MTPIKAIYNGIQDGPHPSVELKYCIQCRDKITGQVGDFAYHANKPFEAVSPVFPDLIQFFMWTKQNRYLVLNDLTLTQL